MNELIIILILILLNGVLAMSEIALVSARKSSLSNDIKRGSKTAKTALKLAEEPDNHSDRNNSHRHPYRYLFRKRAGR